MPRGSRNPLHIHPNCEEVVHLLEGSITHLVENENGQLIGGGV
jgi:oxalate decarboxylase/phosphoglucose isomerase-like protein (cupin superfamily)